MSQKIVSFVTAMAVAGLILSQAVWAEPGPAAIVCVATSGDDTSGDGSAAAPYATIGKAVSVAAAGDEIRVRGGLYAENIVNSSVSDLTILGGYDESWTRDLKGSQTIVRAATANQPVVAIQNDVTGVRLGGLVLTGGSYGIKTAHVAGMVFEQLVISNNTSYAIGYSDTASDKDGRMTIASCLIADNGAGIKEDACGWSKPWYVSVYSCTFLNNRNSEFNGYGAVTFRNNVFVRKTGAPSVGVNSGNMQAWYYDNCVAGFGTTVEEKYPGALQGASGNIYDPALVNDDGTLSDASPCLRAGGDLSTDETCPVLVDLYGTAWDGEYDMGCLKSAEGPRAARDIHVATTGSDEMGDGTAEKPYASIGFAIGQFAPGDRILVQGGTYVENIVSTTDELVVLGSFDANWAQDLKDSRTVVEAADASRDVLFVDGAFRNRWSGIDLKGGKNGLVVFGFRGGVFAQMRITGCSSSGVGFGDISGDVNTSNVFAGLYVADNGGTGVFHYKNNWGGGYRLYWYNCTFANNQSGALNSTGWHTFKNCVFFNPDAALEFNGTGNTHLEFTACCVRDGLYGSTDKTIVAEPETLSVDAKLDADGRLTQPSLCNKRGTDLSADAAFAVTADLEGAAWDGAYDMGCFKSPYPWVAGVVRLKDVYVSADGDDVNDGTAEHPVATLLQGLYLTDAGGTCHVGPGGFRGGVTLERCDMTLVGSGMGVTVVTGGSITIGAHGGTVRDLSLLGTDGNGNGLVIAQGGLATNATVACCDISSWGRGISAGDPNEQEWDYSCNDQIYRFSHLVVTNCGVYGGVYARGRIVIDNCLLALNNSPGLHVYSGAFRACNCTFADNFGKAVCGPDYDTRYDKIFVNCIFSGSDIAYRQDLGGVAEHKSGEFSNCLFNCARFSYNERLHCDESVVATNDCVFGQDPQFRMSARKRYHVGGNSPAHQTGLPLEAVDDLLPPSTQTLDGKSRGRFWDMGCYNDPAQGLSILLR